MGRPGEYGSNCVTVSMYTRSYLPRSILLGVAFSQNLWLFTQQEEGASDSFMMLGLGDMALPGMALALLLCHDYRRASKRSLLASGSAREGGLWTLARSPRFWSGSLLLTAACGYGLGLVTALAAGILSTAAQPALLYIGAHAVAHGRWRPAALGRPVMPPGIAVPSARCQRSRAVLAVLRLS